MSEEHNHEEGHECEYCKNGVEATKRKEEAMLQSHGWFVHFVPGSPGVPYGMNAHTHGLLENFKHMDLQICISMPPQAMHSIFVNAIQEIKAGKTFKAGEKYDDLIESTPNYSVKYKVLFLEAEEGDRKVLRMIFPDKDGGFNGPLSKQLEGCTIPVGTILSADMSDVTK